MKSLKSSFFLLGLFSTAHSQEIPNVNDRLIVSVRNNGTQVNSNDGSYGYTNRGCQGNGLAITPNGRFVAFESDGVLLGGDSNNKRDIYVRDRLSQPPRTWLASRGVQGVLGTTDAHCPSISNDGTLVAFASHSSNMWPGLPATSTSRIYVRNLETQTTRLVNVRPDGSPSSGDAYFPYISGDGRFVAFISSATDLVSNVQYFRMPIGQGYFLNGLNVYVRDLLNEQTELITRNARFPWYSSDGVEASRTMISNDGRFVSFISDATDIATDFPICWRRGQYASCNSENAYVYDRQTDQLRLIRVPDAFAIRNTELSMSPNGRWLAFRSTQSQAFGTSGIFVFRNSEPFAPATAIPGTFYANEPNISSNGLVVFETTEFMQNGSPFHRQIHVYDSETQQTRTESRTLSNQMTADDSWKPVMSGNGKFISFRTWSAQMAPNDGNTGSDVIIKRIRE